MLLLLLFAAVTCLFIFWWVQQVWQPGRPPLNHFLFAYLLNWVFIIVARRQRHGSGLVLICQSDMLRCVQGHRKNV